MSLPESGGTLVLLHNPRCSKSRQTKSLLEERGVAFEERLYLEDPLSRAELDELGKRLGRPAREWTRTKESAFGEAGRSFARLSFAATPEELDEGVRRLAAYWKK